MDHFSNNFFPMIIGKRKMEEFISLALANTAAIFIFQQCWLSQRESRFPVTTDSPRLMIQIPDE